MAAWVHDYAPRIRGMVLAAPAFAIRLYVPPAIPGLRLLLKLRGERQTFIKSYVKSKMLTHLLQSGQAATADEAIGRLRAVRPTLVVRPEAAAAVARFALSCNLPAATIRNS